MKTLLLMRHAKSSWKDSTIEDCDRPLNKRGEKDAPMMGELLFEKELTPQKIYCSTALRARLTAESVAKSSHFSGETIFMDSFYLGEPVDYLEGLRAIPDDVERVLIIGHNPGLEGLLQILSDKVESLPTAAIAHIVLPIKHWSEITDELDGDLISLWRPGDLKTKDKAKEKEKEKDKGKDKDKEKAKDKKK